jgi:hypothetical protein
MVARARGLLGIALVALLAVACDKKKTAAPVDPPPAPASPGPRIMPAVGADIEQMLPDVPPGYTACTKDAFASRIDEKTAEERAAVWQAEAAKARPSLHRVDARATFGIHEDASKLDWKRSEDVVRFKVPKGELELRFPGQVSSIIAPQRPRKPPLEPKSSFELGTDFVLAPLDEDARVMVGAGWSHRDKDGFDASLHVDVFLVKESLDETVKTLTKHAEHALEAITCSIEEGWYQRGAYRATSEVEPDGSASIRLGGTAGGHCTPRASWKELLAARRVADVTVVLACRAYDERHWALCRDALASAHLR